MISGPFLDQSKKRRLMRLAEALDKVVFLRFHLNLMATMANADLIICMGGYNTLCEILSMKKWALVVPRVRPAGATGLSTAVGGLTWVLSGIRRAITVALTWISWWIRTFLPASVPGCQARALFCGHIGGSGT